MKSAFFSGLSSLFLADSSTVSSSSSAASSSAASSSTTPSSDADFWGQMWGQITGYFAVKGVELVFRILVAVIVLLIGSYLIKLICALVRKSVGRQRTVFVQGKKVIKQTDPSLVSFITSTVRFCLGLALGVAFVAILGIQIDGIVSIISSSFLAVGIGLKDVITNFADGVILISEKNIQTGDVIKVDAYQGTVSRISMVRTTLITNDGSKIFIPNSGVSAGTVINYSSEPIRRISLSFPFKMGSDIDALSKTLTEVALSDPRTLKDRDHPATCLVSDFCQTKPNTVILTVSFFCRNAEYDAVKADMQQAYYRRFLKDGISCRE
jgi:small conductance mechanosensitive channel